MYIDKYDMASAAADTISTSLNEIDRTNGVLRLSDMFLPALYIGSIVHPVVLSPVADQYIAENHTSQMCKMGNVSA